MIADLLVESELSEETDAYGPLAMVARTQGLVGTESAAEEIRAMGRRALAVRCDVTDREQVAAAVARAVDELGSVDILVNNAGTLDHVGQFPDQQPELWERDLRVNLSGAFNCAQAVWPHMKERKWGRIVNMASVAGTLGGFGQASYSTTKAGVLGLTKTLAMEGGRHGITANAIVPGIIGTEAFHMANAVDERADREPHRLQAPGRAAGHRERDRLPLLRPRLVRHRDRAERLRRRRAVRLLERIRRPRATMTRPWLPRRRPFAPAAALGARSRSGPASASLGARRGVVAVVARPRLRRLARPARDGTRIAGIDVGGLTPADARAAARSGARRGSRACPSRSSPAAQRFQLTPRALGVAGRLGRRRRRRAERQGGGFGFVRGYRRLELEFFPEDLVPPIRAYDAALDLRARPAREGDRHAAPRGAARPARPAHHDRAGHDRPRARPHGGARS